MPKVSSVALPHEDAKRLKEAFLKILTNIRNTTEVETLLVGLLTHTEVTMFSERLRIARMLLTGNSYAKIRKAVKVTDYPIIQMNNVLHTNDQFKKIIRARYEAGSAH